MEQKYRGHFELANGTIIDLVNTNQEILKDTVQSALKGGCRFENSGSGEASLLVYHPSVDGGRNIIGWVAPGNVVTEPMTNQAFLQKFRLHQQQAA